jgi:hypothetical protein
MRRIHRGLIATLVALALVSASPAFAQVTSQDAYDEIGGRVESNVQGSSGSPGGGGTDGSDAAGTTAARGGENLPFTGLDLGLLAAGGAMLLGVGLGVRRLAADTR